MSLPYREETTGRRRFFRETCAKESVMRILSIALAMGLMASPASAQLLGGGGLGGLTNGLSGALPPAAAVLDALDRSVARSRLASDPLGVQSLITESDIPSAPSLLEIRRERLRQLVRDNTGALEADPNGDPVRRNEILAMNLTQTEMDVARAQGFTILRDEMLDGAGLHVEVLQPPRNLALKRAMAALKAAAPTAIFDYNAIFEPAGAPLASSGGGVAPASHPGSASGVVIGMVDGGVAAHAAFSAASIEQRGFAGAVTATGHGTAVASLLVGSAPGFNGAAQGARLLVADVYGGSSANGSAEAIARAVGWLVGRGARVINISLVGPPNELLRATIDTARAKGVLVVAAVGNDGPAAPPLYPASFQKVIAVTGVDARDRALVEAGRALHLDFAAPGAGMAAALPGAGYVAVRGTSFAAPLVAARLAVQSGDALSAVAAEARPGRGGAVGRGIVCGACRNDPRTLRIKSASGWKN
jgi:hypothetical protein